MGRSASDGVERAADLESVRRSRTAGVRSPCGPCQDERPLRPERSRAPPDQDHHVVPPLHQRLGGEQGIHAITRDVVSLHPQNPPIRHDFEKVDPDVVAKRVTEFIISGTGGPQVYKGPDLTSSHRSLKLTNRDFVLAGGDVVQAMKGLKYGPEEIEEVVCTLVSLRAQVVLAP